MPFIESIWQLRDLGKPKEELLEEKQPKKELLEEKHLEKKLLKEKPEK